MVCWVDDVFIVIEEDRNMKRKVIKLATMGAVAVITTLSVAVGNAVAKDKLVIAVPTFLTGGGAP